MFVSLAIEVHWAKIGWNLGEVGYKRCLVAGENDCGEFFTVSFACALMNLTQSVNEVIGVVVET
jgi:hypothetical protein